MSRETTIWVPVVLAEDGTRNADIDSAGHDSRTHHYLLKTDSNAEHPDQMEVIVLRKDPWHMVQGLAQIALDNRIDGVVQPRDLNTFLQGVVDLVNLPQ